MRRRDFILGLLGTSVVGLPLSGRPGAAQPDGAFCVQWTLREAPGWECHAKASEWERLPRRPPAHRGGQDNEKGWVAAVKIGGKVYYGWDHYAILPDLTFIGWDDDVEDDRFTGFSAVVCKDGKCVLYHPDPIGAFCQTHGPCQPWSRFLPPADDLVRHGIFVPKPLWLEHRGKW